MHMLLYALSTQYEEGKFIYLCRENLFPSLLFRNPRNVWQTANRAVLILNINSFIHSFIH